jgi:hypothetical protein
MRKGSRRARPVLVIILLVAAAGRSRAEGGVGSILPALSSTLPVEAPSSVFSAKLGKGPDADAELLMSGSWSATILGSLDLQEVPGSSLSLSSAQPLLFTQDPDLSLSFLLYKKIFVEARVSQDVSQAMYSAGYRGGKDELLKEARIGNDKIDFPTLPFLSFGEGSYRSFGASALIETDDFQGKAMVRYDQASRVTKQFVGTTAVTDTVLGPNSFVSGMYFMTYTTPVTNLAVYVQSASGTLTGSDGYIYRKLDASEYSYSATTGLVKLAVAATTRVLAYYPGAGSPLELDPLTGLPDAVTIIGVGACDFLYEPPSVNHTSPTLDPKLGALNYYATTATASTAEVFVRNPSSGARDPNYQAVINSSGYIEVTQVGNDANAATNASNQPYPRNAYRQPFGLQPSYLNPPAPAGMAWIYKTDFASTANTTFGPVFTREVVVRSFASSTTITIDKDFVAGSIEVTRNGLPDYAFSVNADSGVVTFGNPPSADDNISISYLRESSERKSGILLGALGGFWDLGASRSAWAALGAAWSLPGSSYSSGGTTSPGSVSLTAGEKDTGGAFQSSAAIAAQYSRSDSTGTYRIEGMESTTQYATSFQPGDGNTQADFTAMEIAETSLASNFPSQVNSFHADGTTQKAMQIVAGPSLPTPDTADYYKVEENDGPNSSIPYASFGTFVFYAKLPPDATLTVKLDDGSAAATTSTPSLSDGATSVGIQIPVDATRSYTWKRYALHYGKGDSTVYIQDTESGVERALVISGVSSKAPSLSSVGSRLLVAVSGLSVGEVAWVDEVLLEDAGGSVSLLFQGTASYSDPKLVVGRSDAPILSDISASAFAEGALNKDAYASGGGSVKAKLGFVGLGLDARATVSDDSTSFSGGHNIELPASNFPVKLKDGFDYDPSSGAFGRSDSLALLGGHVASLSLSQTSSWTPPADVLDTGVLLQSWDGSLSLGPSFLTLGLSAKNRAMPSGGAAPSGSGGNYASAWLGAFRYLLPADESDSDERDVTVTLSVKGGSKEFLSASLGESATPSASDQGIRADTDSLRLSVPFSAFGIGLEPYYSRAWTDQRNESAASMVGDAQSALGDLENLPLLYRGIPFSELFSPSTASDFSAQTAPSSVGLPAASYQPEAGLKLTREYGSRWYDLVLPSALDCYYGRNLTRAVDTVTDSSVVSASAKIAAINVFGTMGAYPLGLPFDSDEYLTTLQANLSEPRDGSASTLNLLYHGLATFYAGQADRLDAESKLSIADLPSNRAWSCSLSLALSRKLARHWLLDLYSLAVKPGAPKEEAEDQGASAVSLYLSDLKTREPVMRSTWTLVGGLSGVESDATAYQPGWSASEAYEAKLTVPERLTFKVDASLGQSVDASTRVFTLDFLLSLNAVISF